MSGCIGAIRLEIPFDWYMLGVSLWHRTFHNSYSISHCSFTVRPYHSCLSVCCLELSRLLLTEFNLFASLNRYASLFLNALQYLSNIWMDHCDYFAQIIMGPRGEGLQTLVITSCFLLCHHQLQIFPWLFISLLSCERDRKSGRGHIAKGC